MEAQCLCTKKQPATDTRVHLLFVVGIRMNSDISNGDAKAHTGMEKNF